MTMLSSRIVDGEGIAIASPCRKFGEGIKASPKLTGKRLEEKE
jgi:hypothetical protein